MPARQKSVTSGTLPAYGASMSIADAQNPVIAESTAPPAQPAVPAAHPAQAPSPVVPSTAWVPPAPGRSSRRDGLGRDTGRLLAGAFALAWILCPTVEPLPAHDVPYPLWQLPIDVATVVTIVAAVAALWRGSRNSAYFGMAAGVCMAVMTMLCPFAGHTPVGWWTWVQTGLSLFVMATSAVLLRLRPSPAPVSRG